MKFQTVSRAVATSLFIWSAGTLVFAAALVNINTADVAALETLNGIGPSKAQAIIDYRTQHGPFAAIEDIQSVSGIGPSTYANIKDYITVGDASAAQTSATQTQAAQAPASAQAASSQTNTSGLPPVLTAKISGNTRALAGAGSVFDGAAYNQGGDLLVAGVRYIWNFGDGTTEEGKRVLHTYAYPGTYSLELSVAYDISSAMARMPVAVTVPDIALVSEGDGSLTIYNHGAVDIDVGLWSIVDGTSTPFTIPQDTLVLAGQGVRFAPSATRVPGSRDAKLLFPNGATAASARVGDNSPLRGERVVAAPIAPALAPVQPIDAATSTQPAAVAAAAPPGQSLPWLPLGGLAALLATGGAGAWYAGSKRPAKALETSAGAEEFDIES